MELNKIYNILNNGGTVVMPTDTVYGIIGDALNENSADKIYKIKNRDYKKPFIILISDIEMLCKYVKNISALELELMNTFWPGPLTIILEKTELIPNIVTSNSDYVAVRIPNDKLLIELIKKLNRPLISTSANLSGNNTITNTQQLEEKIIKNVDYIYDIGSVNKISSTLIKVEDNLIKIIRDGELRKDLEKLYNTIIS